MDQNSGPLELTTNLPDVEVKAVEAPPKTVEPAPSAEELLLLTNNLGESLRTLIIAVKKLPKNKALEPHQDAGRSLALAQAHLQTGFMWLRRAIEVPKVF